MKKTFFLILFFLCFSCSKTKTVLICGDHICINKDEAEQYFEDNLSLEVRILDKKDKNKIDLVELNLKSNEKDIKSVSITEKKDTYENIKILNNDEIKKKKAQLKERKQKNKLETKKKVKIKVKKIKENKISTNNTKKTIKVQKTKINSQKQIVDICVILKECNIDEISKYLIEQGKKRGFPDITLRE